MGGRRGTSRSCRWTVRECASVVIKQQSEDAEKERKKEREKGAYPGPGSQSQDCKAKASYGGRWIGCNLQQANIGCYLCWMKCKLDGRALSKSKVSSDLRRLQFADGSRKRIDYCVR